MFHFSFLAMAIANFFTVSSFGTFFMFPLFIEDHGGSKADIGIVMGAMTLASVLSRPWISQMIDRIGRKKSYSFGSLLMTLAPLAYLPFEGEISRFYLTLLLVRIIHGIGLATCFTAAFTYIADIVPEGRMNEGLGMFGVTGLTGMAVGPVLGEMIIERLGFSSFFLAASVLAALGLLLHLPIAESYVPKRGTSSAAPSFLSVLKRKRASTAAALAVLFGVGLAASGGFVSPFAEERNIPFISIYYMTYSSMAVLTRLLGGRLSDRVGEERIIPFAILLTGLGLSVMMLLGGSSILAISGLMTGCGHGFLFPALNSLAVRSEPLAIRGKITGAFTGGIDAGAFTGSIMLGFIGEFAGFRAIFLASALALLSGLPLFRSLGSGRSSR